MKLFHLPSSKSPTRRPIIGLALGSGSARGLAHIGVLRALEEAGIEANVIAGTSIGALVGAVYAAGRIRELEAEFRRFDWKTIGSMFDPVFPRSGLINGRKIEGFIKSHLPARTFDELPIPFRAVATDLGTGHEVILADGDLLSAVRASISVPGILTPVNHDGRILLDGGLVNPVPVSVARALGADIVIAVDLNHDIVSGRSAAKRASSRRDDSGSPSNAERNAFKQAASRVKSRLRSSPNIAAKRFRAMLERERPPSMFEVLTASLHIMEVRITESRLVLEKPEVLIRPPLSGFHLMEFDRADELISLGYRTAQDPLSELSRQLNP